MISKRPRSRKRAKRSLFVRAMLRVLDLVQKPISMAGVHYPHFRALMEMRLMLDSRSSQEDKVGFAGKSMLMLCFLYVVMGIFPGILFAAGMAPFWGEVIAQGMTILFLTMGMVVEFSSALLDPSDAAIVHPAPVNDRTVLFARVTHVCLYLGLLLLSMMAAPLVLGPIEQGALFIPLHVLCSLLSAAFSIFLVVLLYMLTLKTVGIERFKSVVTWVQMGVIGVLYGGMYGLQPVIETYFDASILEQRGPWLLLFPPAWFGGLYEAAIGSREPVVLWLAVLAVVVPVVFFVVGLRLSRSRFLLTLAETSSTATDASWRPGKRGLGARMEEALTQPGAERAGMRFFLTLARREHRFRMQVWPMVAMIAAMAIGNLVRLESQDPMYWSFAIYALFVLLPMVTENARFGESPEAIWMIRSAPIEGAGAFLGGVMKGMTLFSVGLPGIVLLALIVCVFGVDGLMHGVLALESTMLVTLVAVRWLVGYFPFSKTFRMSLSGTAFVAFFGCTLLALLFMGAHLLLTRETLVACVAIVALSLGIVFAWGALGRIRRPVSEVLARTL